MTPADSIESSLYLQIHGMSGERIVCAAASVARMSTGARANLVEKVEEITQKHKVVVFAKSYCPYCAQVGPTGHLHLLEPQCIPARNCDQS